VLAQQQATSTPALLKLPVSATTGEQASPKLDLVPALSMSTRASEGLQQNPTITTNAARYVGSYSAREMDAPSGDVCSPGRMRILVEDPELRRATLLATPTVESAYVLGLSCRAGRRSLTFGTVCSWAESTPGTHVLFRDLRSQLDLESSAM
jgi:hypothetical protein